MSLKGIEDFSLESIEHDKKLIEDVKNGVKDSSCLREFVDRGYVSEEKYEEFKNEILGNGPKVVSTTEKGRNYTKRVLKLYRDSILLWYLENKIKVIILSIILIVIATVFLLKVI